jgi:hypothetical protein
MKRGFRRYRIPRREVFGYAREALHYYPEHEAKEEYVESESDDFDE